MQLVHDADCALGHCICVSCNTTSHLSLSHCQGVKGASCVERTLLVVQGTTRVDSVNISKDMEDISPDRVFDFEAASRRAPSPEEAQALQALREKLQAEIQVLVPVSEHSQPNWLLMRECMLCFKGVPVRTQMTDSSVLLDSQLVTRCLIMQALTNEEIKAVICESDIPGTLIIKFMPASLQEGPAGSSIGDMAPHGLTMQGQLSLRVDTTYPKSTPAYFRHVMPEQTLQQQMQVLPFFQACKPALVSGA